MPDNPEPMDTTATAKKTIPGDHKGKNQNSTSIPYAQFLYTESLCAKALMKLLTFTPGMEKCEDNMVKIHQIARALMQDKKAIAKQDIHVTTGEGLSKMKQRKASPEEYRAKFDVTETINLRLYVLEEKENLVVIKEFACKSSAAWTEVQKVLKESPYFLTKEEYDKYYTEQYEVKAAKRKTGTTYEKKYPEKTINELDKRSCVLARKHFWKHHAIQELRDCMVDELMYPPTNAAENALAMKTFTFIAPGMKISHKSVAAACKYMPLATLVVNYWRCSRAGKGRNVEQRKALQVTSRVLAVELLSRGFIQGGLNYIKKGNIDDGIKELNNMVEKPRNMGDRVREMVSNLNGRGETLYCLPYSMMAQFTDDDWKYMNVKSRSMMRLWNKFAPICWGMQNIATNLCGFHFMTMGGGLEAIAAYKKLFDITGEVNRRTIAKAGKAVGAFLQFKGEYDANKSKVGGESQQTMMLASIPWKITGRADKDIYMGMVKLGESDEAQFKQGVYRIGTNEIWEETIDALKEGGLYTHSSLAELKKSVKTSRESN